MIYHHAIIIIIIIIIIIDSNNRSNCQSIDTEHRRTMSVHVIIILEMIIKPLIPPIVQSRLSDVPNNDHNNISNKRINAHSNNNNNIVKFNK